mgnify:CR=1 FL=1
MNRRFGAFLCAGAMAVTMLTGCGGGGSDTAGEEDNQFVVGMECNYAPFNWLSSNQTDSSVALEGSGYADGYDVMIAQNIADQLGMELVIKQITWDSLLPSLQSGDVDAVIAGMTANEIREESADFTTPYYDSQGMIMIVRKDSDQASYTDIQQFSGQNVVGQLGTNYDDVIDQIEGVNHVTPKDNYPEMVLALQNGDVDGITAEIAVAEGIVAANPDLTYITFDEGKGFEADTTVSIAMPEGSRDSDFFNQVQEALDNIDQDTRTQYMQKAVEIQPANEQ